MHNLRHGDLAFIQVKEFPEGLKASPSKTLMKGSNNNDHAYDRGTFYPKTENSFVIGYFVAKNTTLLHVEHGKVVKGQQMRETRIPDGVYQLRRQNEDTHEGMRAVLD